MRFRFLVLALAFGLSISSTVLADCMARIPRYVEMRVESCVSAAPRVRAVIAGKDYSERQAAQVDVSTINLFIVRARPLADVDILEWYSDGSLQRYRGPPKPIKDGAARDYLVDHAGGCDELLKTTPHIYDVDVEKPCRDVRAVINGQEEKETDARLLLDLPEAEYFPDQESLANLKDAYQLLRGRFETGAPGARAQGAPPVTKK